MSRATKRKHYFMEMTQDDYYSPPKPGQEIVKVTASRGNNLHEVKTASGENFLVSMPTKYRRFVWVKRGDYILVEHISEGVKVKAEIVKILTTEHVKIYKKEGVWPEAFGGCEIEEKKDDEILLINPNRPHFEDSDEDEEDVEESNSEEEESEDSEDESKDA